MMYLNLIICVVLFMVFILIIMNIIIGNLRTKENKRIEWKIKEMDKRDRVVTRTGGLENDRLNERQ